MYRIELVRSWSGRNKEYVEMETPGRIKNSWNVGKNNPTNIYWAVPRVSIYDINSRRLLGRGELGSNKKYLVVINII